jgi:hypothetical protein
MYIIIYTQILIFLSENLYASIFRVLSRLRLRWYMPTRLHSVITYKTTTSTITYTKTSKSKLFILFQLPEERWKALTSVPRSTPDAAWDRHLLDWIRHQAWWGATSAFCRIRSYLVPIPTARCNSSDCAVRHYCVSGSVCHLQENNFYLYRKNIEKTEVQLRKEN